MGINLSWMGETEMTYFRERYEMKAGRRRRDSGQQDMCIRQMAK